MVKIPDYIGPMAYGLKMGVILPGMDLVEKIIPPLADCYRDGLLGDNDVICITESIVARAQNNYVTIDDIAREITGRLRLMAGSKIGVVFPIASRNRFSMILKGIARAVQGGEVIVQFSYPNDEVGNQVVSADFAEKLGKEKIISADLQGHVFKHPVTGVDYIDLYRTIITSEGARPTVYLSNNPLHILDYRPDGIIAADIHTRFATRAKITALFSKCITLDQLCTEGEACSEWGLLGSNMSAGEKLKLAPREGRLVVENLQRIIKDRMGIDVQVIIYGDGAYLDPSSGIYELADPRAAFAATGGLNCFREGIKYKYLADHYYYEENKTAEEIEAFLAESARRDLPGDSLEREGTTPRRMEDLLASLADLISGSADAGTPVVVVRGFLR